MFKASSPLSKNLAIHYEEKSICLLDLLLYVPVYSYSHASIKPKSTSRDFLLCVTRSYRSNVHYENLFTPYTNIFQM